MTNLIMLSYDFKPTNDPDECVAKSYKIGDACKYEIKYFKFGNYANMPYHAGDDSENKRSVTAVDYGFKSVTQHCYDLYCSFLMTKRERDYSYSAREFLQ